MYQIEVSFPTCISEKDIMHILGPIRPVKEKGFQE